MVIKYLLLPPDAALPDMSALNPFRSIVVLEETVTPEWQSKVSSWLVQSGCLYMMAWGKNCTSWDDSVDMANLERFDFQAMPEENRVMTTWHERESLLEVFWFAKNCAVHPIVEMSNILLLHIANKEKEQEFISAYAGA